MKFLRLKHILKNGPPPHKIFYVRIVGMCGPVHLFSRDVSIGEWIRSLDVALQERQPLRL